MCGAHRADRVMVGGQWRVENGDPIGIDVAELRKEHGEAAKAFLAAM
jgi:8-oxoguanine deaminase